MGPKAAAAAAAAVAAAAAAAAAPNAKAVDVRLTLSRPRYRSGGVVVGTVHLSWDADVPTTTTAKPYRPHSARLYLSGHARIDPRWLNDADGLRSLYGRHPSLASLPAGAEDRAVRHVFGDCADGVHLEGGQTVCFYATNVVDLLAAGGAGGVSSSPGPGANADASGKKRQRHQMAFTFRSTLPDDAPPSSSTATARYFYSAVVCIETGPYEGDDTVLVQAPFAVTQGPSSRVVVSGHDSLGARVKVGTLEVLSRCSARAAEDAKDKEADDDDGDVPMQITTIQPPCYVPPTEWHRPAKLAVDRDFGLCSRPMPMGGGGRSSDVKSLRIVNEDGIPCCVLTLVGTATMRPGGRAVIRCDFAEDVLLRTGKRSSSVVGDDEDGQNGRRSSSTDRLLPCYRVSAFLRGEECALNEDGTSRRTRSYAFDASHVRVEPGCTDSVSLNVGLPLSCPISMHTDLVKVATTCKIVLTVKKDVSPGSGGSNNSEGANQYDFLTLEMPCEVVHGFGEEEEDADAGEHKHDGVALIRRHPVGDGGSNFAVGDIMTDLKVLTMSAATQ